MYSPQGGDGGVKEALPGRQAALLYFDELQITDPFTAVTLKAVFEELVAEGAALLVTSAQLLHYRLLPNLPCTRCRLQSAVA